MNHERRDVVHGSARSTPTTVVLGLAAGGGPVGVLVANSPAASASSAACTSTHRDRVPQLTCARPPGWCVPPTTRPGTLGGTPAAMRHRRRWTSVTGTESAFPEWMTPPHPVNITPHPIPQTAYRLSLIGVTIKDVTTYDSADVTVPDRPVGPVNIAGMDFEMRCPKLRVWMAIIERQEDYDAAQALKPHILDFYRKLAQDPSDEERTKLIEQYSVLHPTYSQAPTALQLADLLLEFLCSCMTNREDAEKLRRAYTDDDGPCDIPHLRIALDDMDEIFSAWLDDQADTVGVKRPALEKPEPANRQARRETARQKKTVTKRATVAAAR